MAYLTFNDVLVKAGITNLNRVLLIRHSLNHANFAKCYSDSQNRDLFIKTYTACQSIQYKGKYDYGAVFNFPLKDIYHLILIST